MNLPHPESLTGPPTPSIVVDGDQLARNIRHLQDACDRSGVELRPHIKTHKMVEIARRQLEAGAAGLTCAKLGEAEAMLPSGVRSLFLAHSLVDVQQASRVAALADQLDDLRVAVTSLPQAEALAALAARAGRGLSVMMAVDTGLGREGVRDAAAAERLAAFVARDRHLELRGFYTHEGNFYAIAPEHRQARTAELLRQLEAVRDAVDPALPIWPGCSVTVHGLIATAGNRIGAVRPGAYVFGDLYLTRVTGAMPWESVALHVLATVVDTPEPGLALIDAGSKTFSSDRTPDGLVALCADGRDLAVFKVNEEHGYLRGNDVGRLRIGERLALVPAHVCPVVNLTDSVYVTEGGHIAARWRVDARGRTQ